MESTQSGSPKYWLSLDQWRQDTEFQELMNKEFVSSPLQEEDGKDGWARREFLKLMGASMALTTFGCVRRPAQKIVPYIKQPAEIVNGIANTYASSFSDGTESFGILVTTREGRPIKVEGNPQHPINQGGMSARAHSHILRLYDPDRLNGPRRNLLNEKKTNRDTVEVSWESLDKAVGAQMKKGGVAVLTSSYNSPSMSALLKDFSADVYVWDALADSSVQEAQRLSYGSAVQPRYRLDRAQVIVSVGADILGTYLSPVEAQKQFAKGRKPGKDMNKLVVFESLMSLTGANADQRFRIKPSDQVQVVMGLIHDVLQNFAGNRYAGDSQIRSTLESYKNTAAKLGLSETAWNEVVQSLVAARGKSLVVAGGLPSQTQDSLSLQVAVNFLNSVLENDGVTVDGSRAAYKGFQGSIENLKSLVSDLNSGKVKTLVIHHSNPLYAAPKSLGLAEALVKAEMVIYTGDRNDETGLMSNYIAPDHHEMESWGDQEPISGVFSIQQPTIQPLYSTRAFGESLMAWSKAAGRSGRLANSTSWYDYVRDVWKNSIFKGQSSGGFEGFWMDVLKTGVFDSLGDSKNNASASRSFNSSALGSVASSLKTESPYQLVLYPTVGLKDGSLANVSWLQEFPDPVTKICWDNYVCISLNDAKKEKLVEGQVVHLTVNNEKISVPVHIQPGQADGVLGLAVGYGRWAAGEVANGVGVNAFGLMQEHQGRTVASGLAASIERSSKKISLANVQGHHSMEGRQIVVEATLDQFMKDPNSNIHRHKEISLWSKHEYPKSKWGMVIDLNTCTGCSACIIACQSENNIPTVGKKYVLKGREMHWIRIDRYYVGDPVEAAVVNQPIVCMHCDNAPCETVCPVAATVHSDEGTNDMIYNRCVGTRYCSNNCPYKVRRFNWFDYVGPVKEPLNLAMNPEVTVRSRGVMEKCTFCIHRIKSVRQEARTNKTEIKDGDIKTACQQSCPTNAIVFGDLNDPNSEVAKLFNQKNSYDLLEELNVKPAVRYQSKVRNVTELKADPGKAHGHASRNEQQQGTHS